MRYLLHACDHLTRNANIAAHRDDDTNKALEVLYSAMDRVIAANKAQ